MKQKKNTNHSIGEFLEREVRTPNGRYFIKLAPARDKMFINSYDLYIKHLNPGILEKLLRQDIDLWENACYDYEAEDQKHGKVMFENTTPYEVGYNYSNGRFFVSFSQDIKCSEDGLIIDKYRRSKSFPIPETTSRKFKKLLLRK